MLYSCGSPTTSTGRWSSSSRSLSDCLSRTIVDFDNVRIVRITIRQYIFVVVIVVVIVVPVVFVIIIFIVIGKVGICAENDESGIVGKFERACLRDVDKLISLSRKNSVPTECKSSSWNCYFANFYNLMMVSKTIVPDWRFAIFRNFFSPKFRNSTYRPYCYVLLGSCQSELPPGDL